MCCQRMGGDWRINSLFTHSSLLPWNHTRRMLVLPGSPVFSDFRRASLLETLKARFPALTNFHAYYIHLVLPKENALPDLTNPDAEEAVVLKNLLQYGPSVSSLQGDAERLEWLHTAPTEQRKDAFFVLPRPGTISPWSSKATDIAHMCNLENHVDRIERGIAYFIETESSVSVRYA